MRRTMNGVETPALKVTGGTPADGKVLTSDADGVATWQAVPGSATSARKSSDQTINSGTAADLASMSISVSVPGTSAVYVVLCALRLRPDDQLNETTRPIFQLVVDSTVQTGDISAHREGAQLQVQMPSSHWVVSGLSAGSHTFKMQGKNASGTGATTVKATDSVLTVVRIA